ncbi:MAG: helix-turn-helix domain-containing protein, partial [Actinomycetes bacterium]
MTLGEIIRASRLKRGWVQEDLARAVGVRAVSVSIWETDKSLPDPSNVKRLIAILDLDADAAWLAFGRAVP